MSSWKDNLTKLTPYEAGEQLAGDDVIKLNANENPYPPSPEVGKVLAGFPYEDLNQYPPLGVSPLDQAIADHHGVDVSNVLSGNSSDEIFAMCYKAFFNSDKPVIFPDITYSFYPVWCSFYDIPYEELPLDDHFKINVDDYLEKENGGMIIANPNAPTGIELGLEELERLIAGNTSSVIIVDEAYSDFGTVSAIELIGKYDNVLVTKTLSKARGLAGLRVGYAVGSPELIKALGAAMYSFNGYPLSSISIKTAEASMKDEKYFGDTVKKVINTRERMKEEFSDRGFELTDSRTNFLFVSHKDIDAGDLYSYLLEKKILVRHFGKDRIDNYLRIAIGTDPDMEKLLYFIDRYMEG